MDNELEPRRGDRSGMRQARIAEVAAIRVDADLIVRAGPVYPPHIEPEIHVGFVVRDPQRPELQWLRKIRIGFRRGVQYRPTLPIAPGAVDGDRRVPGAGAHRDHAVVFFGVEHIEPEPLALRWILELHDEPVFLEPLIDERKEAGSRGTGGVDVPGGRDARFVRRSQAIVPAGREDRRTGQRSEASMVGLSVP